MGGNDRAGWIPQHPKPAGPHRGKPAQADKASCKFRWEVSSLHFCEWNTLMKWAQYGGRWQRESHGNSLSPTDCTAQCRYKAPDQQDKRGLSHQGKFLFLINSMKTLLLFPLVLQQGELWLSSDAEIVSPLYGVCSSRFCRGRRNDEELDCHAFSWPFPFTVAFLSRITQK